MRARSIAVLLAAGVFAGACDAPPAAAPAPEPSARSAIGAPTRTPVPTTYRPPEPADPTYANCAALRRVYPAGVPSDLPAYRRKLDRDRDGWACELAAVSSPTRSPTPSSVAPSSAPPVVSNPPPSVDVPIIDQSSPVIIRVDPTDGDLGPAR